MTHLGADREIKNTWSQNILDALDLRNNGLGRAHQHLRILNAIGDLGLIAQDHVTSSQMTLAMAWQT